MRTMSYVKQNIVEQIVLTPSTMIELPLNLIVTDILSRKEYMVLP